MENRVAHYHLPGLFEFYDFYKVFLSVFKNHRDYFYEWCDIASIYGSPCGCLWGGGRIELGKASVNDVMSLLDEHRISGRLTFSNSLLAKEHLRDKTCNSLCKSFSRLSEPKNGVIVHSNLLRDYLFDNYPSLYLVSSTTKVITDFNLLVEELNKNEFSYVVPDFRLNKQIQKFSNLGQSLKDKLELLCNECCSPQCSERKQCYESVSSKSLGYDGEHICTAHDSQYGYRFSKAMENPMFIGIEDIQNTYLPIGITNYKIEGRGLGSALLFEMLLYYMVKPEYQIKVRELVYLDNMLDLF